MLWKDYGCGPIKIDELKDFSKFSNNEKDKMIKKFLEIATVNKQYKDKWLKLPSLWNPKKSDINENSETMDQIREIAINELIVKQKNTIKKLENEKNTYKNKIKD